MREKYYYFCGECNKKFLYSQDQTWWIHYPSEDVKVVRCDKCNSVNVIKKIEIGNDNLLSDDEIFAREYYEKRKDWFV